MWDMCRVFLQHVLEQGLANYILQDTLGKKKENYVIEMVTHFLGELILVQGIIDWNPIKITSVTSEVKSEQIS